MSGATFYVDASIIAGLVLGDINVEPILAALTDDISLTYSAFGFGEAVPATSTRTRAERGGDDDAAERIRHLHRVVADWKRVDVTSGDLDRGIVLTGRASLALKFPDAIHIAIAERLDHLLLTLDQQQHRAARSLRISSIFPAISG